jgi:signal transduction histidine kinase
MEAATQTGVKPPRPKSFGLAIKITLPFVALFASLLLALGIVLAREVLAEMEARIERQQRFALLMAKYATNEQFLSILHDAESRSQSSGVETHVIVFSDLGVISTIQQPNADDLKIIDELKALRAKREFTPDEKGDVQRQVATLNGKEWSILFRSYVGPAGRRDIYHLYPYAEIQQAQFRALQRIALLGGLGLLCAIMLGLLVGKLVARPVVRLATAARHISAGGLQDPTGAKDLDIAVTPNATDEIGDMALAFQTMLSTLRKSQEALVKSERLAATGKLAASVAHEIRNPLTSLRMTAQMLQQRAPGSDPATREGYALLLREIDRLALAVEELLTFARPRPPHREPTDVNKLVTDTLKFMEHQLAHAKVKAVADLDPNLPATVPVDQNKVRQLLVNLVLNAQQAIVRDGTVTVRTKWDGAAKFVTLSVADTGPGVADEVRDKLFDLFVSTKTGGGGIGLAVARQISEEHGGSIGFESSPKGANFMAQLKCE